MIAVFLAALQIAAAQPIAAPESLLVKDATREKTVALVPGDGGPLLRADALRPVVPMTVSHLTGNRWMLIVNGAAIQVEQGSRFAKVGDDSYQLAAAVDVRKGELYVPLQLVVEVVPRVATNLVWDASRFELAEHLIGVDAALGWEGPARRDASAGQQPDRRDRR